MLQLTEYITMEKLAAHTLEDRLAIGTQVFYELIATENNPVTQLSASLLDRLISKIDELLSAQLDEILHHECFQNYEASWRSLQYLVSNIHPNSNIKIELLDISKQQLQQDFTDSAALSYSGLYEHIYTQEYDTPGGEPIAAIIADYEIDSTATDIKLLAGLADIAAAAHCPVIAAVGAKFFGKQSMDQVAKIKDLSNYMERAEFIRWNALRNRENSRYLGLTLPRFLLRLPYGEHNPARGFCYFEQVSIDSSNYLWGNSNFVLAVNLARSFQNHGWTLNIRGPESGGKISQLPLHQYDIGQGLQTKIPTEIAIPESRELEYAKLGFIPLSYYKNSDFACFFSANSIQKPQKYSTPEATANSRINAKLPYILLCSRLGHYLKVLQRENIGTTKNRHELEKELNNWLQTLITKMNNPSPEIIATHPLRAGEITVTEIADNPGFYRVAMAITPHFQVEGMDISLTLVGNLPKAIK